MSDLKSRVRIGTTLSIEQRERLKQYCKKTGLHQTKVIELAIDDFMKKYPIDEGKDDTNG